MSAGQAPTYAHLSPQSTTTIFSPLGKSRSNPFPQFPLWVVLLVEPVVPTLMLVPVRSLGAILLSRDSSCGRAEGRTDGLQKWRRIPKEAIKDFVDRHSLFL